MKPMPNIWLDSLLTFDETLTQIEICLDVLKDNAENANFLDNDTKKRYSNDVIYMKQFFEKAESLARGK